MFPKKKQFGDSVLAKMFNEKVKSAVENHLRSTKNRPVEDPRVMLSKQLDWRSKGYFSAEVSHEVMLDLPDIDFFDIRPVKLVASDPEDELNGIMNEQTESHVDKDGAAEDGDLMIIDFIGDYDDEIMDEYGNANRLFKPGDEIFVPGFDKRLVDLPVGDQKRIEVPCPRAISTKKPPGIP